MNIDKKKYKALRVLDDNYKIPVSNGHFFKKWLEDSVSPDGNGCSHLWYLSALLQTKRRDFRDGLTIVSKPMCELAGKNYKSMANIINSVFLKPQSGSMLVDGHLYLYYLTVPDESFVPDEVSQLEQCIGMAVMIHIDDNGRMSDADFIAVRKDYEGNGKLKCFHDHCSGMMNVSEKFRCCMFSDFQYMLSLLAFIQYADTEVVVVNNGQKKPSPDGGEVIVNASGYRVRYIDSRWVREIIRTEGFKVSGHFRLQPYGKGRTEHKLIYINEYHKNGYHRRAAKDISNQ